MRQRARLVGVLLLGAAFAVGGVTGMVAEEGLGLDWFDFLDEDAGHGEERLLAGLSLTAEQERRIGAIQERRDDRLEEYWRARLTDIQHIMGDSYAEMRQVLTPEQHPAFDQRVRALQTRISADRD